MTEISRRQFAVSLVVVVLVVLLGGRALRADAGAAGAGDLAAEDSTSRAAPGAVTGADGPAGGEGSRAPGSGDVEVTATSERPLVHVAGAVRRPGVYELAAGARIRDAVARAGGGRTGADLDRLNLAAKVTDGQQVLVVRRGRAGLSGGAAGSSGAATGAVPATAGTTPGAAPADGSAGAGGQGTVNVNQADAAQLELLDGVGPAIAAKIIDWRTQNGPFRSVDDLAQVAGIGPKKLEAMRAQATT